MPWWGIVLAALAAAALLGCCVIAAMHSSKGAPQKPKKRKAKRAPPAVEAPLAVEETGASVESAQGTQPVPTVAAPIATFAPATYSVAQPVSYMNAAQTVPA